jgi:hypothetical protein
MKKLIDAINDALEANQADKLEAVRACLEVAGALAHGAGVDGPDLLGQLKRSLDELHMGLPVCPRCDGLVKPWRSVDGWDMFCRNCYNHDQCSIVVKAESKQEAIEGWHASTGGK